MSWTQTAASVLPIVGSTVSSLIGNSNITYNNKENRAWQTEQQEKQNRYNTASWQMQNEYNSPEAQVARLRKAGLNPALVYGNSGGTTGNVAAPRAASAETKYVAQPKQAPELENAAASALAAFNNLRLGKAQSDNLTANTTVAVADAAIKGYQQGLVQAQTGQTLADIDLKKAQTQQSKTQERTQSTLLPYDIEMSKANTRRTETETQVLLNRNEREAAMNSSSLREAAVRIINLRMQTAKGEQEIRNLQSQLNLINNDAEIKRLDAELKEQGIQPHENVFMRMVGSIIQSGKESARKLVQQWKMRK